MRLIIVNAVYNGERPFTLLMSHYHCSCAMGKAVFSGPSDQLIENSIPLMHDIIFGLPEAFIETHSLLKMF